MIKVVLADDHIIFRQGLAELLASVADLSVIGQAANGEEAWRLLTELRPELAILDISMPAPSGIELAQKVRQQNLPTKVILLTMHHEAEAVTRALQAGVAGYVLKDNAFEELIAAVRAVIAGGAFFSASIPTNSLSVSRPRRRAGQPLTKREREILALIAAGLTNRQIAAKLFLSIKTVETHRTKMMKTLDLHTTAELVRYAIEHDLA